MNKGIRFTDEFKQDAVAQVVRSARLLNGSGSAPSRCTLGRRSLRSRQASDLKWRIKLQR